MNLITCEDLKSKLDRKDIFKLVFTLGEWHFRAMHIPDSILIDSPEHALKSSGFPNVRRFAGGLEEWQNKGLILEGEMVP